MLVQRLDEPSFPELVVLGVEGLGDPIGVDCQKSTPRCGSDCFAYNPVN